MKVAILGAGNVAMHLSKALIKSGYPVVQVWSRNHQNAINLALQIGANSIHNIQEIDSDVDLVIIAVNDDAIANVAERIPKIAGRIVTHTSGSTGINVLGSHSRSAVLYPLQTFSKAVDLDFSKVPLCIEASDKTTEDFIFNLARKIADKIEVVSSDKRAMLHIAAVFACNFTNYFYAIAEQLINEAELDFDLVKPLISETVNKISVSSPSQVQTGPAVRKDENTMNAHLKALENNPALQNLYRVLSQNIVKKYAQSKSSEE